MLSFTIENRNVTVFPSDGAGRPVIYLNTVENEGARVREALRDAPDFTLVAVDGLDWNCDMSPWAIPAIAKNAAPCTGGADAYLKILTERIAPEAEERLPGRAAWRGIAGYSLAGLFAVYALYHTRRFSRAASMSGSLWFPGFREYVFSQALPSRPERMYFSLGNKEDRTRNPYLQSVRRNTEEIEKFYREQGIETTLQLHPGNHYANAIERTAAGIAWLLEG